MGDQPVTREEFDGLIAVAKALSDQMAGLTTTTTTTQMAVLSTTATLTTKVNNNNNNNKNVTLYFPTIIIK